MDLNIGYFLTLHGLLFVAQFLLSMIVVICVGTVWYPFGAAGVVFFTSIGCMITSFVMVTINLLNIPANASHLPWILIRLIISGFWAVFYFISLWISVAGAAQWTNYHYASNTAAYTAAAVFCAIALIICAWDAIIYFFKLRQGPTAQNPT